MFTHISASVNRKEYLLIDNNITEHGLTFFIRYITKYIENTWRASRARKRKYTSHSWEIYGMLLKINITKAEKYNETKIFL